MRRDENILRKLDWLTIGLYLVLVICGWLAIYAATYDFETAEEFTIEGRPAMQLVWMGCALGLAVFLLAIDSKFYSNIAYIFYALMMVLLIVTIFVAPDIKGSHSWLRLGPVSLQPAEFAKYATALCLARMMSTPGFYITRPSDFAKAIGVVLLPMAIIVAQSETGSALVFASLFLMFYREGMSGLVLVLGMLAVFFFIVVLRFNNLPADDLLFPSNELLSSQSWGYVFSFLTALVVGGFMLNRYARDAQLLRLYVIVGVAVAVLGCGVFALWGEYVSLTVVAGAAMAAEAVLLIVWTIYKMRPFFLLFVLFLGFSAGVCFSVDYAFDNVLEPHQQTRIKVVLGLEEDPMGAGYNVRQSKVAIGSGGFLGKGFLNGTQTKLKYVPEQDTDFIFCTIGEERGFLGSSLFIMLYVFFIVRLVVLAERQRSAFSRIYGYSVACIFFFHFFVNIGMVLGLLPVIGIPLPFISYGGSSMWSFTILLFTFLKLDSNRMDVLQY